MIIYSIGEKKYYETCSLYPSADWTGKAEMVVDETIERNKDLQSKIEEYAPYFDYVLDDEGNLVDVVKTGEKTVSPDDAEIVDPIAELRDEIRVLKAQNQALSESNQFLEDCLAEMAETVYA